MNRVFFAVFFLSFMLFLPHTVNADGFNMYMDTSGVALHGENTQIAAINYEDGVEKLLLAVKTEHLEDDSVVWIVPVAADASEVNINIFTDFPRFHGNDILMMAEDEKGYAYGIAATASMTQIYPAFIPFLTPQVLYTGGSGPGYGRLGETAGVEIYATVEKGGITTQVLTAETSDALYSYLNGKNITIGEGSLPILEEYIGEDYAFVVSWVRAIESNESYRTPSIFVEFPTDEIYYPLKPTSIYGDRGIPILIYVVGLVEPELYQEIEEYAYVRYFDGQFIEPSGEETGWLKDFYTNATNHVITYYTTIMIGSESSWTSWIPISEQAQIKTPNASVFVQDLWIRDSPPPEVEKAFLTMERIDFLSENYTVIFVIWLVASSLLASWLAGLLMFKGFGLKTALVGLANCLTLFVFIIAAFGAFKKEEVNRPKFILAFTIIFMIINFLVFAPLVTFFLL